VDPDTSVADNYDVSSHSLDINFRRSFGVEEMPSLGATYEFDSEHFFFVKSITGSNRPIRRMVNTLLNKGK
jgi:hypothetical protein